MPATTRKPPITPKITLDDQDDGVCVAVYEVMTYRFLLMDGRTIDVRAIQADSYLTDAVLKKTGAKGISGVTTLDRPTDEKGKGDERVGPTV